jgi:hypothetical protein
MFRTTFYTTEGDGMFVPIATIAIPPALIVTDSEDSAGAMRGLLRAHRQPVFDDLVELDPLINAQEARARSVEVRTLAEIEQDAYNERFAMEVV